MTACNSDYTTKVSETVSVQFSLQLCASGYKYHMICICSSNLPGYEIKKQKKKKKTEKNINQRTNGPANAHLISWPSKAQNIQNMENIWSRNDLDLQYSHTFINSISCLHLPTFRSLAAIVSEKSTVFTFPHRKT